MQVLLISIVSVGGGGGGDDGGKVVVASAKVKDAHLATKLACSLLTDALYRPSPFTSSASTSPSWSPPPPPSLPIEIGRER